ncbi:plastocyanin/azurin family copper-binding protein [Halorussus amylolyticus]|uniref:plastocyanin/azurin family copper-binding protein n=1 Tax=Halorussus amylolyticus TaxID=1126242 RepID=UPI0010486F87|nr:plastocyanin/azurin family copper-binding protein [Halorussus amylolyticus]
MTDSTRRRFLATTVVAAATGLAGCAASLSGNDSEPTDDYSLPAAESSLEIGMGGRNVFDPEIAHLEVGGTVTWTNDSGNHSATAYHPDNDRDRRIPDDADSWDSGVIREVGGTFERTFDVPGVYDYYCTPHEPLAMVGTLVVGDPAPADQPGLEPPGDDFSSATTDTLETLNAKVRSGLE